MENNHITQMAAIVNVQPINCSYFSNTVVLHVLKVELDRAAVCKTIFLYEVVFCSVRPFSFLLVLIDFM